MVIEHVDTFTNTNPVRQRRTYTPNLDLVNFDLSNDDLTEEFDAGEIIELEELHFKILLFI